MKKNYLYLTAFASALLSLPAFAQLDETPESILEACPNLTAEQAYEIANPPKNVYGENAFYAYGYCVPLAEGMRRMALQEAFSVGEKADALQKILSDIRANEPTYVGEWYQHEPVYGFAIGFTENAEATLAKYTDDPDIIGVNRPGPKPHEVAMSREEVLAKLETAGIRYSSAGFDVAEGIFNIQLMTDDDSEVKAMRADGRLDIPDWVIIKPIPPLPNAEPKPVLNPDRVKVFPRSNTYTYMMARPAIFIQPKQAELELINGCLSANFEGQDYTLIWAKTDSLDLRDPDKVSVMSRHENGPSITVGDTVSFSGIYGLSLDNNFELGPNIEDSHLGRTDIQSACPGPYHPVDGYMELGALKAEKLEQEIKNAMRLRNLSRSDAAKYVEEYEAFKARVEAVNAQVKRDHGDVIYEIYDSSNVFEGIRRINVRALAGVVLGDVIPDDLIGYAVAEDVAVSHNMMAAKIEAIEAPLKAFGVEPNITGDANDGRLYIDVTGNLSRLSDALLAGDINFSDSDVVNISTVGIRRNPAAPHSFHSQRVERRKRGDYTELTEIVRDYISTIRGTPRDEEVEQGVMELLNYGFTPKRLNNRKAEGLDTLKAFFDRSSSNWEKRLADKTDWTGLVTVAAIDTDTRGDIDDGYRSTITLAPVDKFAGDFPVDDNLKVRMIGGIDDDGNFVVGSNEPPLLPGLPNNVKTGDTLLVQLSRGLYNSQTEMAGFKPSQELSFMIFSQPPQKVIDDDIIRPLSEDVHMSIEAYKATLKL